MQRNADARSLEGGDGRDGAAQAVAAEDDGQALAPDERRPHRVAHASPLVDEAAVRGAALHRLEAEAADDVHEPIGATLAAPEDDEGRLVGALDHRLRVGPRAAQQPGVRLVDGARHLGSAADESSVLWQDRHRSIRHIYQKNAALKNLLTECKLDHGQKI